MLIQIIGQSFLIFFIALCLFLLCKHFFNFILIKRSKLLKKTLATIEGAELITDPDGDQIPQYKYTYTIQGKTYSSAQVNAFGDFQTQRKAILEFRTDQVMEISYYTPFPHISWIKSSWGKVQIFGNCAIFITLSLLIYVEILLMHIAK